MKRILASLIALAAFQVYADESTDQLRKEFDNYKKASEARIQSLENQITNRTDLTQDEIDGLR